MGKLLSANFFRLKKSKPFYAAILSIGAFAVIFPLIILPEPDVSLDNGILFYTMFIGIAAGAFCSLFIGEEYAHHTLRNKLIAGHKRTHVYLANYIVCTTAGLAFCAVYIALYFCSASILLGEMHTPLKDVGFSVFCSFLLTASYCAIFTAIAMLCQNRAITAVVNLLLAFVLLFGAIDIAAALLEPETVYIVDDTEVNFSSDGVLAPPPTGRPVPNPRYLSGTERAVYLFLYDFLPGCQAAQLSGMVHGIASPPLRVYLYELLLIGMAAALGLIVFQKKNLT